MPVNYATGASGDVVASDLSLVPPRVAADTRKEGGAPERRREGGRGNGGRGDGSCPDYWWQGSWSLGGGFQEEEIEGGEIELVVRKASPS